MITGSLKSTAMDASRETVRIRSFSSSLSAEVVVLLFVSMHVVSVVSVFVCRCLTVLVVMSWSMFTS